MSKVICYLCVSCTVKSPCQYAKLLLSTVSPHTTLCPEIKHTPLFGCHKNRFTYMDIVFKFHQYWFCLVLLISTNYKSIPISSSEANRALWLIEVFLVRGSYLQWGKPVALAAGLRGVFWCHVAWATTTRSRYGLIAEWRENSLFDTGLKSGSLFDTGQYFLPYLTSFLNLFPYMTL
jgi:hypothetical protein